MTADDDLTLFDDVPGRTAPATGKSSPGTTHPGTSNPATGNALPGADPACPPGQAIPRNGQECPRVAGGDPPHAFDWSIARGVSAVDPQGYKMRARTLEELLRAVPRGATVIGESTFESFDLRRRQQAIDLAESRDVTFLTVPTRGNPARRRAAGFAEKTNQSRRTDYEDALAIQYAAVSGAHLKKPVIVEDAWAALREEAGRRFVYLRYSREKEKYATRLLRHLPPYSWQPDERRIALGPVGAYNLVIVAAIGVAAEFVSARADFERLTGLYAHGYPSQFRSDLMHWGWGKCPKKRERISLSVYRRELRWLFHKLRSVG